MIVIRYHQSSRKKAGAQWLCRCDCGAYELRHTPAIKRLAGGEAGADKEHCCAKCDWLRHIRFRLKSQPPSAKRAADLEAFERIASAKPSDTCGDCPSPVECRWNAKCKLYHTEAA
jgi:hypothetical protein